MAAPGTSTGDSTPGPTVPCLGTLGMRDWEQPNRHRGKLKEVEYKKKWNKITV